MREDIRKAQALRTTCEMSDPIAHFPLARALPGGTASKGAALREPRGNERDQHACQSDESKDRWRRARTTRRRRAPRRSARPACCQGEAPARKVKPAAKPKAAKRPASKTKAATRAASKVKSKKAASKPTSAKAATKTSAKPARNTVKAAARPKAKAAAKKPAVRATAKAKHKSRGKAPARKLREPSPSPQSQQ